VSAYPPQRRKRTLSDFREGPAADLIGYAAHGPNLGCDDFLELPNRSQSLQDGIFQGSLLGEEIKWQNSKFASTTVQPTSR
jgi:hypothetical protein